MVEEEPISLADSPLLLTDSASVKSLAHNRMFHALTKHNELDHHLIHDLIVKGDLVINHISTFEQVVDSLIQPLASS